MSWRFSQIGEEYAVAEDILGFILEISIFAFYRTGNAIERYEKMG